MNSEAVALSLREHQVSIKDWDYAGLARELHRWVEIFDVEFKLDLPSYPVLRFAPLRNAYANYTWFRGEVGTKDNITFNTHELQRDPSLSSAHSVTSWCTSGSTTTVLRRPGIITTPNIE